MHDLGDLKPEMLGKYLRIFTRFFSSGNISIL
jgi:hypothetical protein